MRHVHEGAIDELNVQVLWHPRTAGGCQAPSGVEIVNHETSRDKDDQLNALHRLIPELSAQVPNLGCDGDSTMLIEQPRAVAWPKP